MMRLSFRHLLWNGIVRWPIPEFGGGQCHNLGRVGMWYCGGPADSRPISLDAVETPALIAHALVLQFLVQADNLAPAVLDAIH